MRKFLALCGAVLYFAAPMAAQDQPTALAVTSPMSAAASAPARQQGRFGAELYHWQVGMSYEYIRFQAAGTAYNLHGFNTTLTRFVNDWVGVEGVAGGGFGAAVNGQNPKLLVYGGGLRFAHRSNPKIDTWVHGLVGGAHFQPQTALGGRNAFAYVGGGGVDLKFTPRLYWRFQGDFVGSRFFSQRQSNFQVTTGFVIDF